MSKVVCPNCYSKYEDQPEKCECGYPFGGDDMEKFKFMSAKRKQMTIRQEGEKGANLSRNILFIIGGLNLVIYAIISILTKVETSYLIAMFYGVILIGLGFYSYKEPFLALLLGFLIIVIIYGTMGLLYPGNLLSGFSLKIIFLSSLIYGLVKVKRSENINKKM